MALKRVSFLEKELKKYFPSRRWFLQGLLATIAGSFSLCCKNNEGPKALRTLSIPKEEEDDDSYTPGGDDLGEDCSTSSCVEEYEDLERIPSCENHCSCTEGYLGFLNLTKKFSVPRNNQEVWEWLQDMIQRTDFNDPFSRKDLRERMLSALNNKFLYEGMNERVLRVTTIGLSEGEGYERRDLLFEDPYVGEFSAVMLLPKEKSPPYTGIAVFHGHTESPDQWIQQFQGEEYPRRGYALLIPSIRVLCGPPLEDEMTREFFRKRVSRFPWKVERRLV
ncbi:MAG: hypothetical protein M5R36_14285 [Deltaproteobacteria bacterium]|nr:hypothetical protein [Deltaproteobacteria bacterium]